MNDSALKSFCTWARTELIKGVEAQMVRYGITEPAPAPAGSETVNGLPLSPAEVEQRDELLHMQAEVGHEALRDRAAYTWFNRIVAHSLYGCTRMAPQSHAHAELCGQ